MNQRVLLNEIGGGAMASTKNDTLPSSITDGHDKQLDVFSFESIVAATNCFSVGNKLGEGGFGPVYKVINGVPEPSLIFICKLLMR